MTQTVAQHVQAEPVEPTAPTDQSGRTLSRLALGIGLAVVSGVLAGLSFEDFHIWPLIWIAFVPALVAQHHVLPRKVSGLGLGIAVGVMFQFYMGPGLSDGK